MTRMLCMCNMQVYSGAHGRTMIFTRTKAEANELALSSSLKQDCQVLHGDIQQKQREITLKVPIPVGYEDVELGLPEQAVGWLPLRFWDS